MSHEEAIAALVAVFQELYRRTGVTSVEVEAYHYTHRRLSQITWVRDDQPERDYVLYRPVPDSEIVAHVRGHNQSDRLTPYIPFGALL